MNKIAVIGSNSFTGVHFVKQALARGMEVLGISRSPLPHRVYMPVDLPGSAGFDFRQLDLNRDMDAIELALKGFAPEAVVNFASQSMVAQSWENPRDWFMTNVVSTVDLHERLRRMPFLQKYVHVSTPEVYGDCEGDVAESTNYNPSTPYAVSRACADMSLMSFFRNYDFPVVFTRAANVYGSCQQQYRIVPRTALCCLHGEKLQLHGGGVSRRSFIHVDDVAEGTIAVMLEGELGEVYHLATREAISVRELVEKICAAMGTPAQDIVEIADERPGKDSAYLLDTSKARTQLGWSDKVDLEGGLRETIDWVKANGEELAGLPSAYIHKE